MFKFSSVTLITTANITNKDVVATLQSDIPIEMNMSNSHTFTENGSFTFKFVLNGEEKEITATVDWIDKKAPVITGYENRVDELEAVVINNNRSITLSIT